MNFSADYSYKISPLVDLVLIYDKNPSDKGDLNVKADADSYLQRLDDEVSYVPNSFYP